MKTIIYIVMVILFCGLAMATPSLTMIQGSIQTVNPITSNVTVSCFHAIGSIPNTKTTMINPLYKQYAVVFPIGKCSAGDMVISKYGNNARFGVVQYNNIIDYAIINFT